MLFFTLIALLSEIDYLASKKQLVLKWSRNRSFIDFKRLMCIVPLILMFQTGTGAFVPALPVPPPPRVFVNTMVRSDFHTKSFSIHVILGILQGS